jgi:hypothetical protein
MMRTKTVWTRFRGPALVGVLACVLVVPLQAQFPEQERSRPPGGAQRRPPPSRQGQFGLSGWMIRSSSAANLWFHALAVIAADQPGPLGLYSADYARHVRDLKQEMGVYPTALDSAATELRERIGDGDAKEVYHFIPLYFPRATAETLIRDLRGIARRSGTSMGRDIGTFQVEYAMNNGGDRGLLDDLVDAIEKEWNAFYREYWENTREAEDSLAAAVQEMWDTRLAPQLFGYLEERRLTAGLVMPSPALGPEGRIFEMEQFVTDDQIVAVQKPLLADGPEETVFAFLKELCFLLVDDRELAKEPLPDQDMDDLRRTAAVRCGAAILEFYAPEQVVKYRRTFLDAVGAEESATVDAFERVYYLEPDVARSLHEQIRTN